MFIEKFLWSFKQFLRWRSSISVIAALIFLKWFSEFSRGMKSCLIFFVFSCCLAPCSCNWFLLLPFLFLWWMAYCIISLQNTINVSEQSVFFGMLYTWIKWDNYLFYRFLVLLNYLDDSWFFNSKSLLNNTNTLYLILLQYFILSNLPILRTLLTNNLIQCSNKTANKA